MTVTPEDKRIIVLIKGTSKKENDWIKVGGQFNPNSKAREREKWK